MPRFLQRAARAIVGLCLMVLPLSALVPSRYGAPADTTPSLWNVPWPSTPSQTAMREAAAWWAQAVQLASDEMDQARETLQAWDPNAPVDPHVEQADRRRFLAADHGRYLERALAAAHSAERLAQTPGERRRAERYQQIWKAAVHQYG